MTALPLTPEGFLDGAELLTLLRPVKRYVRPQPTDAMRVAAARFGIDIVTQPRATGCLIAVLAMLTGHAYDTVFLAYARAQGQVPAISGEGFAFGYLLGQGFLVERYDETDAAWRTPAHPSLLEVSIAHGAQGHRVVLLPCGTVIDPLLTVPTSRAHYTVRALWSLTPPAGGGS